MTVLTEELVFARTKTNNLGVITELNCWGSQLTDVSILQRMPNVKVLSLSVNNMETLKDIQFCTKLQDLFMRKNHIKDLNEVCFLRDLTNLKNLWLADNPCANEEGYRLAVIKALPRLEKLDNIAIEPSEHEAAVRNGRTLSLNSNDERGYYSDPDEEPYEQEYIPPEQNIVRGNQLANNVANDYQDSQINQYIKGRDRAVDNYAEDNGYERDVVLRVHNSQTTKSDEGSEPGSRRNSNFASIPRSRTQPNVQSDTEYGYSAVEWKRRSCGGTTCCIQPHLKRPNERRTNVLNAVLCLIKELDYPNLEVVQMAVKCRMEELADEINTA